MFGNWRRESAGVSRFVEIISVRRRDTGRFFWGGGGSLPYGEARGGAERRAKRTRGRINFRATQSNARRYARFLRAQQFSIDSPPLCYSLLLILVLPLLLLVTRAGARNCAHRSSGDERSSILPNMRVSRDTFGMYPLFLSSSSSSSPLPSPPLFLPCTTRRLMTRTAISAGAVFIVTRYINVTLIDTNDYDS